MKRGGGPLQRQLEDQLRAAIRAGALVAGERLPASRLFAADLGVSRGVVSDAYGQLAAEGWLVVAPRAVAARRAGGAAAARGRPRLRGGARGRSAPLRRRRAPAKCLTSTLPVRRRSGTTCDPAGRTSRASRAPTGSARSAPPCARPGSPSSTIPPIAGATELRAVVAAYRGRVRGTVAGGDDVILCAGAGQAFVTLAEALGPVRLAVEDPGHEGIRGLFAKRGLEPVPVRVDEEGIVVAELPDDARAVLLTPAHQFPTGAVLDRASAAPSCCAGPTSAAR